MVCIVNNIFAAIRFLCGKHLTCKTHILSTAVNELKCDTTMLHRGATAHITVTHIHAPRRLGARTHRHLDICACLGSWQRSTGQKCKGIMLFPNARLSKSDCVTILWPISDRVFTNGINPLANFYVVVSRSGWLGQTSRNCVKLNTSFKIFATKNVQLWMIRD